MIIFTTYLTVQYQMTKQQTGPICISTLNWPDCNYVNDKMKENGSATAHATT